MLLIDSITQAPAGRRRLCSAGRYGFDKCAMLLLACGCSLAHEQNSPLENQALPFGDPPAPRLEECDGDWSGDGMADLMLFERRAESQVGAPAASVQIYRGGPNGYEPGGFWAAVAGQDGQEIRGFTRPRPENRGVRDAVFFPQENGAAIPSCGPQVAVRATADSSERLPLEDDECPASEAVAHVGDMTGDGVTDQVSLVSGGLNRPNTLRFTDGESGESILFEDPATADRRYMGIGDINGDSADDLLAWDTNETEISADVFYGQPFANLYRTGIEQLEPTPLGRLFASPNGGQLRVRALGDINGDRRPDFAAVEVGFESRGRSLALSQQNSAWSLESLPSDQLRDLQPVGDINCDGYDDVLELTRSTDLPPRWVQVDVYFGGPNGLAFRQTLSAGETADGAPFLPIFSF